MNKSVLFHLAAAMICTTSVVAANDVSKLRAPAYPLITIDPYISAWSMADNLYDEEVKHWTETAMLFLGVITVDDTPYRFMGNELPQLSTLVYDASGEAWVGKYTTAEPASDWYKTNFDDSSWSKGEGAFGSIPEEHLAKTEWATPSIWVRRTFTVPESAKGKPIYLNYSHDDDVIIYINGIKVVDTGNDCKKDVKLLLPDEVTSTLATKGNIIAAYCHDRGGLAFLNFGLDYEANKSTFFTKQASQIKAGVMPMNTIYTFECGQVELTVKFTNPAFLDNLELLSRPVNYITYSINSLDGKKHDVKLYFEAGREWAVDNISQKSVSEISTFDGLTLVSTANKTQNPLNKGGDHTRIDWGKFYLASPSKNCIPFI